MEQPAVKRHSRIDVADVLRGFAVMGIVLLHTIEHYNFYSFPDTSQQCTLPQLHRQGHLGRALLHLRRQGLRHLRPALRIQFLHSGRQPTPPRTRFQTQVLLAAGATLRAGKHQRRILHGRSARIVLPRGVRAGSHMPHVGPRGIHHSHRMPAAAAALDISHPRGRRPGIHLAQYPPPPNCGARPRPHRTRRRSSKWYA